MIPRYVLMFETPAGTETLATSDDLESVLSINAKKPTNRGEKVYVLDTHTGKNVWSMALLPGRPQ